MSSLIAPSVTPNPWHWEVLWITIPYMAVYQLSAEAPPFSCEVKSLLNLSHTSHHLCCSYLVFFILLAPFQGGITTMPYCVQETSLFIQLYTALSSACCSFICWKESMCFPRLSLSIDQLSFLYDDNSFKCHHSGYRITLHLLIYFVWKQFIKEKKRTVNQKNKIGEKKVKKIILPPCWSKNWRNWASDQLQNITKNPNTTEMVLLPPDQGSLK